MEDRTATATAAAAVAAAAVVAVASINGGSNTAVSTPTMSAPSGSVYPSPINQSQSLPASMPPSESQSPLNQLPPLTQSQQQTPTMQPLYTPTAGNDHASRGPGTPTSVTPTNGQMPNFAAAAAAVAHSSTQSAARGALYSMTTQSQYPPPQAYTSSMMSQSTPAISHPQPIAPAPSNRSAPILRPMPHQGIMQPGMPSPYGPGPLLPHTLPEGEPTHVVGSQGRRGILPSAPGRPSVSQMGGKGAIIPQKDADGKFPCPHCTKTYLHAKHLKRHLLRHTGDRPYMCVLCRDTFSRSDILKRHFQKCSIRRGNPTGVGHLSHPQAHVKKNQQKQAALAEAGDMSHLNGLSAIQDDQLLQQYNNQDSFALTGNVLAAAAAGTRPSFEPSYTTDVSVTMPGQPLANYSMSTQAGGLPMYGSSSTPTTQQSGLDWAQMFQPGA